MTLGKALGPQLSIVVASYNAATTIERCLASLNRQAAQDPYEVIVVDSSTDGTATVVAREFPNVRLVSSRSRLFPGSARNLGVAQAKGDVIAFTDADCVVGPDWVRLVLEAHRGTPHPLLGGTVDNANPESWIGWAYYFCSFSPWIPQPAARPMVEIPTTCLTLKRWLFDKYGPFLEGTYCSDSAFNWKVGEDGLQPILLPSLQVSHLNITALSELIRRKSFHGKCFARVRMTEQGFSRRRRLTYVVLSPLLPALLFFRIASNLVRKHVYGREFVLVSPLVFLGLLAWSWGELLGYLSKPHSRATRDG